MAAGIIPRFISRTTGNEVFKLRGAIMPLAAALRDVMLSPKMDYHLTPARCVCSSFFLFFSLMLVLFVFRWFPFPKRCSTFVRSIFFFRGPFQKREFIYFLCNDSDECKRNESWCWFVECTRIPLLNLSRCVLSYRGL